MSFKNQEGGFVIQAILAIALITIVMLGFFRFERWQARQEAAKTLGNQFAVLTNAIAMRMALGSGALKTGPYEGLSQIKPLLTSAQHGCTGGKASRNYLPCSFKFTSKLMSNSVGRLGGTHLTLDVKSPNSAQLYTSVLGLGEGKISLPYLTGRAMLQAEASTSPTNSIAATITYQPAVYLEGSSTPTPITKTTSAANRAKMNALIANIADVNESGVFLRIDGKNAMENNLRFTSGDPSNIEGATGVYSSGADSSLAVGNQQSALVFTGTSSGVDLTTSGGDEIHIGNRSGNPNVSVHDLAVTSMKTAGGGDDKLSSLLGQFNAKHCALHHLVGLDSEQATCPSGTYMAGFTIVPGKNVQETSYNIECCYKFSS